MADKVLSEDEIKKEPVDTCILICSFCKKQEEVFMKSEMNLSSFNCDGMDEDDSMQKTLLPRTRLITSQTISYYLPFSCPEYIVTAKTK